MNCKNCGQPLAPGAVFCGNCGARVDQPVMQPQPMAQPMMQSMDGMQPGAPMQNVQPGAMPGAQHGVVTGGQPAPMGAPIAPNPVQGQPMVGGAYGAGGPYMQQQPGNVSNKSYLVAYLLAQFLGTLGADRFYLGEIVTGILKLITLGGFGIWTLLDIILLLAGVRKDKHGKEFPDRKEHFKLSLVIFIVMAFFGIIGLIFDAATIANLNKNNSTNLGSSKTYNIGSNKGSNVGNSATTSSQTASLGGALTLTDQNGNKLYIVVSKIIPNGTPQDPEVDAPTAGDQLVAVQLSIKDLSNATVSDSVGNSMTVYDAAGHSYQSSLNNVSNCQAFASDSYNLQMNETNSGCEVFEVPTGDTIVKVKFTPSSGYASDTGVWNS